MNIYNVGDKLKLKQEFCDSNDDESKRYIVVEKRKDGQMLCITLNSNFPLPAHEVLMESWCILEQKASYL